jgi:hypothetical protein
MRHQTDGIYLLQQRSSIYPYMHGGGKFVGANDKLSSSQQTLTLRVMSYATILLTVLIPNKYCSAAPIRVPPRTIYFDPDC